jgi:hypothetical protein
MSILREEKGPIDNLGLMALLFQLQTRFDGQALITSILVAVDSIP